MFGLLVFVRWQQCGCGVGVGSGFTLRTADEASLDLITLYTATRSERETRSAEQRVSQSRLMTASSGNVGELQPAVKELCRTLDGFIYVVDATAAADHSLCSHCLLSVLTDGVSGVHRKRSIHSVTALLKDKCQKIWT